MTALTDVNKPSVQQQDMTALTDINKPSVQ